MSTHDGMLALTGLQAGYGRLRVLHDLSIDFAPGEVHAILGRNGAGKTSLLRAIAGLLHHHGGDIVLGGRSIASLPAWRIARLGVAHVPQTRDVFGSLTVRENLQLACMLAGRTDRPMQIGQVLEIFPQLQARLDHGGLQLSGGEQQMVSIARALLLNPRVLLLDEPTEGLAPALVRNLQAQLQQLRRPDLAILLVEQHTEFATGLADRISLIARGRVVWTGDGAGWATRGSRQAGWDRPESRGEPGDG